MKFYMTIYETAVKFLTGEVSEDYFKGLCDGFRMANEEKEQPPQVPKKITRKSVTENAVLDMKQLCDNGLTHTEIAKKLGYAKITVDRHIKGYKRRRTTTPQKGTIDWIRELDASGFSVEDIAERTGYSARIVKRYMTKEGL